MNINPIKAKLQKMFKKPPRTQKHLLSTQANISCQALHRQFPSQNPPSTSTSTLSVTSTSMIISTPYSQCNKQNQTQTFNNGMKQLQQIKQELAHYKSLSKKLREKLSDHQLLEEFYLQELKNRSEVEKELKWKLDILGEEIRSRSYRATIGNVGDRTYSDLCLTSNSHDRDDDGDQDHEDGGRQGGGEGKRGHVSLGF